MPRPSSTGSCLVLPPGLFRLCLAAVVVVDHTLPIQLGLAAVYLFFALSGYWVYAMWHQEYLKTRAPYATFLISRFWRLFPVYFLSLVILVLVASMFGKSCLDPPGLKKLGLLRFYFSNLFLFGVARVKDKINLPAWSLDIEMQFYCIAPLLIGCLKSPRARPFFWVVVAVSLASSLVYLSAYEGF